MASDSVSTVGFRSGVMCLISAALAAVSWGGLAWSAVLLQPVPVAPAILWVAFLVFGVAVPLLAWNRSAECEVAAGNLRIRPQFGAVIEVALAAVNAVEVRPGRLEIQFDSQRSLRLASRDPDALAALLESALRRAK